MSKSLLSRLKVIGLDKVPDRVLAAMEADLETKFAATIGKTVTLDWALAVTKKALTQTDPKLDPAGAKNISKTLATALKKLGYERHPEVATVAMQADLDGKFEAIIEKTVTLKWAMALFETTLAAPAPASSKAAA